MIRNCLFVALLGAGILVGVAEARSPSGTPEHRAEEDALRMMRQYYPAYTPIDAQMRSNRLSITIPARNRIGKRVDFKAYVRSRTIRGTTRYYVGRPTFARS